MGEFFLAVLEFLFIAGMVAGITWRVDSDINRGRPADLLLRGRVFLGYVALCTIGGAAYGLWETLEGNLERTLLIGYAFLGLGVGLGGGAVLSFLPRLLGGGCSEVEEDD